MKRSLKGHKCCNVNFEFIGCIIAHPAATVIVLAAAAAAVHAAATAAAHVHIL